MKTLPWIIAATLLIAMLDYTVVRDKPIACQVPQLSQVLR
jgi:hypothetical protein